MEINVSEATEVQLDWMAAKADGMDWLYEKPIVADTTPGARYTTDWEVGGPIIEREGLGIAQYNNIPERRENRWQCVKYQRGMQFGVDSFVCSFGPTPLIAAMRCFVSSKLGYAVEVPDELCGGSNG